MTLGQLFASIERGEHLPTEPWLQVVPQPGPRAAAVVAFFGRCVVAADIDPDWVHRELPEVDFCAPMNPPFLHALEQKLGRRVNTLDAMFLAAPAGGEPEVPLRVVDVTADPDGRMSDHSRVRRARRYRDDVRVWTTDGGVLVLGRGLAGRWEVAIEVDEGHRGAGLGRRLAGAARHLVPDGRPVWAQVSPGNVPSMRAFLAAGYVPVGAEALLVR